MSDRMEAAYKQLQKDCFNLTEKVIPNLREQLAKETIRAAAMRLLISLHNDGSIDEQDAYNGICRLLENKP